MIDGFKNWRENTTTLPSSRDLDHYKLLLTFDDDKVKVLENFNIKIITVYNTIINAELTLGTPLTKWKKSIVVMIGKIQGSTKIN